jgi:hypothetical protein
VIRILQTSEPASEELSEAVRWYEARRAGLNGSHSPFDLDCPGSFGIRVRGPIQTRQQFGSEFSPRIDIQPKSIGKNGLGGAGHG